MNRLTRALRWFIWDRFNLHSDAANAQDIIDSFRKGVDIKGTNLWILIFAIFIASIGLNVNSTAVIIGAMLISPLMGPIMGFGLGIAINDFQLVKRAIRNLSVAAVISIATSTIYFLVSPISDAQSELLARTQPTVYDVLIALFGGLAGVVAGTRKEKSNVIPGVAIATALMPPLCTAGYGIANGQWTFFIGAFYLFVINSVFIGLSTLLIVRFLKFPAVRYINQKERIRVRNSIMVVTMLTLIPSIYFAYRVVQKNIFQKNALRFIEREMVFDNAQLLRHKVDPSLKKINLVYVGSFVPDSVIGLKKEKLAAYQLQGASLEVRQTGITDSLRIDMLRNAITINKSTATEQEKNLEKVALLEKELMKYREQDLAQAAIVKEANALLPQITAIAVEPTLLRRVDGKTDSTTLVLVALNKRLTNGESAQLENWLKARLQTNNVEINTQIKN
ncbi:TIGR00341 family protein [Flavihumibacter sp.]|uniref:TIGR00341 family protein n=1 Tax=Flavihumibacter sp. TaxID=1913981 RepID=UPI002FC89B41